MLFRYDCITIESRLAILLIKFVRASALWLPVKTSELVRNSVVALGKLKCRTFLQLFLPN